MSSNFQAMKFNGLIPAICFSLFLFASSSTADEPEIHDVVVYGGTSAGVIATIQAKRMGKKVVLIEPGKHLGGLTSGALGATDIGNKRAIGGLSREFYQRVKKHYQQADNWKFEKSANYKRAGHNTKEDAMWMFEPHVAENIYKQMLKDAGVTSVFYNQPLNRKTGVKIKNGWIKSVQMEKGMVFAGRTFIDATYEGDLLAAAKVTFTVGREGNDQYKETLNGVQVANAVKHQMQKGVDPFVKKGDPKSGLLPNIEPRLSFRDGTADQRVQAYNIRICATDVMQNQIPWKKPPGYDPLEYELLLRNFEAGEKRAPWNPLMMPNRKTDANNNYGVSTDYIGQSYTWAEADYETRKKIYQKHLTYTQGLMWTLAHNNRVPEKIRKEIRQWGVCKDEFVENGGWSHQLYVREARRMISDYVMTQHNCQGRKQATDSVGLAAYTMDSHNVMRYVDKNGHVRNEGDVQVGGFPPYPISYRSIVPKRSECKNLLVPVCLSATHIAFGSIRMEPVFMVLGQSAATAACQSINQQCPVQSLDYERLRKRLLEDKQVLKWDGSIESRGGIDPKSIKGIVIDDRQAEKSRGWQTSTSVPGFIGQSYLHNGNVSTTEHWIRFSASVKKSGSYGIFLSYTPNPNRATNVPVTLSVNGAESKFVINQKKTPITKRIFVKIGNAKLDEKSKVVVTISDKGTDGFVIADAIALIKDN